MVEPWLRRCLPAGGRIALDVGANVGTWAQWLADRFDVVHAFEPNPQALAALRGLEPRVRVHGIAIGDDDGSLDLRIYPQSVHSSAIDRADLDADGGGEQVDTITVPVCRIDALCLQFSGVDFVKVDTEGYEVEVIRGALATLCFDRPDLIVEVHAEANHQPIVDLLTTARYDRIERIPHPHRGVNPGHHWIYAPRPQEAPDGE